jgi:hypothetical protein
MGADMPPTAPHLPKNWTPQATPVLRSRFRECLLDLNDPRNTPLLGRTRFDMDIGYRIILGIGDLGSSRVLSMASAHATPLLHPDDRKFWQELAANNRELFYHLFTIDAIQAGCDLFMIDARPMKMWCQGQSFFGCVAVACFNYDEVVPELLSIMPGGDTHDS